MPMAALVLAGAAIMSCRSRVESYMSLSRAELQQLTWRKARRSVNNGDCVEVAWTSGIVAIRDSKNPDGAILACSPGMFKTFLAAARMGYISPS